MDSYILTLKTLVLVPTVVSDMGLLKCLIKFIDRG